MSTTDPPPPWPARVLPDDPPPPKWVVPPPVPLGLDPAKHVISIPVHGAPEVDTILCIRQLDALGLRVDLSKGASAIDAVRNIRASDALQEGLDSILFIDADMMFAPEDAVRLLLSDAPVVGGVYVPKKSGGTHANVQFEDGIGSVRLGEWAAEHGPYPVQAIGAGFLRIKTWVFRQLIDELKLPLCRMADRYAYPLFMPFFAEEGGETRYFCEDYAFCKRCRAAGIPIVTDTSFRLYHLGSYPYGWEDASTWIPRHRNLDSQVKDPQPVPVDPARVARQHPLRLGP